MRILVKKATIIDPGSTYNGRVKDVLIENGTIVAVENAIENTEGAEWVEKENLHLSPGWMDMRANFRDPGEEYKEDLNSGLAAAASGGFTGVLVMPSTVPPIHRKSDVEYLIHKTRNHIVDLFPAGALTDAGAGKEMSEMYDMHQAGALAFTDDKQAVADPNLMNRALLYARSFGGLTIAFPQDERMAEKGQMHEGNVSTMLGLKGIPSIAESMRLQRDLSLVEYTGAKVHFATLSTREGVALIREAKAKGLAITAEVVAHNLVLSEEKLKGFDSHYKVNPPLRSKADVEALKAGLKDGTIDVICSDHSPEDIEHKKLEFGHASFGISSLETTFSNALEALAEILDLDQLVLILAHNPRKILGLKIPEIKVGETANLTLFDPELEWQPSVNNWQSKSKNTPFMGMRLKGRAIGVINHGRLHLN